MVYHCFPPHSHGRGRGHGHGHSHFVLLHVLGPVLFPFILVVSFERLLPVVHRSLLYLFFLFAVAKFDNCYYRVIVCCYIAICLITVSCIGAKMFLCRSVTRLVECDFACCLG